MIYYVRKHFNLMILFPFIYWNTQNIHEIFVPRSLNQLTEQTTRNEQHPQINNTKHHCPTEQQSLNERTPITNTISEHTTQYKTGQYWEAIDLVGCHPRLPGYQAPGNTAPRLTAPHPRFCTPPRALHPADCIWPVNGARGPVLKTHPRPVPGRLPIDFTVERQIYGRFVRGRCWIGKAREKR